MAEKDLSFVEILRTISAGSFESYAELAGVIATSIKENKSAAKVDNLSTVNDVLALGIKEGWILPMAGLEYQWAIVESAALSQKRLEAFVTGHYPVEEFWHRSYTNLLNEVVSPLRVRLTEQLWQIDALEERVKELEVKKPVPPFGQGVHRGVDPAKTTNDVFIPGESLRPDNYYGVTQSDNYGSKHQRNNIKS